MKDKWHLILSEIHNNRTKDFVRFVDTITVFTGSIRTDRPEQTL